MTGDDQPADRAVVQAMARTMRSRGPDDEGYHVDGPVALGMRRLAIIDLQTGRQPMSNEDGSIWVVQNGEIYNFAHLRQRLLGCGHRFRTRSDTEVIVHLYEEHGEQFVEHLNGMFAIAVWDGRRRRLLLVRDRMGQKPLYWTRIGAGVAFASELKGLLAHPAVSGQLDLSSLARYLWYEYVPAPWSIFRGLYKLPAGHRLEYAAGRLEVGPYWRLPGPGRPRPGLTLAAAAQALWERLCQSVRLRLVSDVPLGVFLSGGIDSTAVLAAMTATVEPGRIRTFTIGFDDPSFDESAPARQVAHYFGTEHHEEVFSVSTLLGLLPEVAEYLDEPFGDASILPTTLLSRFARRRVTVALGGDGGDELLAGYPTFQATAASTLYRRLPARLQAAIRTAVDQLPVSDANFSLDFKLKRFVAGAAAQPELAHQLWLGSFPPDAQTSLLSDAAGAELAATNLADQHLALAAELAGGDLLDRLTRLYLRTYLAEDILTKADRASMSTSLELRAPFLDPDLVGYVMRLPSAYKLWAGRTKRVLRRALRGRVPPAVLQRAKKGFGIPVARWLKGELRELAGDLLAPQRLRRQALFNPTAVSRLLEEHWSGQRDNRKQIWTLIMFQLWHDRYGRTPGR